MFEHSGVRERHVCAPLEWFATDHDFAEKNALYVEHIPQLRGITRNSIQISDGVAVAPDTPGIGIDWDFEKINHLKVE